MTSLRELPIGKTATIRSVGGEGALRQHFLDMGLIPKGEVTMVKYAPMGDPMELRIHSYELTLRLADAEKIEIENIRTLLVYRTAGRYIKIIQRGQFRILDLVKAENTTKKRRSIRFRTMKFLRSRLQETRTAVKPHYLIS